MPSMRPPIRLITSLVLLFPAVQANAFAPTDLTETGIEPQRVWYRHQAEQERLTRQSEALRAFRTAEGRDWKVAWDEATGTPRYLWGAGIPVPTDSARLAPTVQGLLERHAALLGFEPGQLARRSAEYHAGSDTWYLDFDVLRDASRAPGGAKVTTYRAGISARVKHGRLILVSVRTSPRAPVTGAWALDAGKAEHLAITLGPEPAAVHTERSVEPMLLERSSEHGLELRRTFQVRSRTTEPPGLWVTFVDAETGELLSVHNEVRFLTGSVTGRHHERLLDGSDLVESPLPLAVVQGSSGTDVTDEAGEFTVSSGPLTTTLDGDYVSVRREDGPEGVLQGAGPDLRWTSAVADQTEIDSYVFLHQVQEWGLTVDPSVPMMTRRLVSRVNMNQTCNAYFDGSSVNFFQAGNGCNNTGQIADVEYHEWGHGFHMYSIRAGFFDGSLSEGAADTVSVFMTGDHYIAPTFFTRGEVGAIRDVQPDWVYPEDYRNNDAYVHYNGLIFGGAMWDLLGILQADEGMAQGQESTENIFAGLLRGGTDIPGTYYEALVADDDDGNLANGTPHACQITEAFGRHGIASLDGSGLGVAPEHEPLVVAEPEVRTDLVFTLTADECHTGIARSATLHYRLNNREWKDSPAEVSGSEIVGGVPQQEAGTFVEYWLEGVDDSGLSFTSPAAGENAPYSFYVGDVLEIGCDTFDEDDGGYRGRLVDDDSSDEWLWAVPKGTAGDPAAAFTGSKVWSTDPGRDESDGTYEANETTRLRSPEKDTFHYAGVFLQYRRWLQVEDGEYDRATIEANGKRVWGNVRSEDGDGHHLDREWVSHSVDLDGEADRGSVTLDFLLASDQELNFGGWNIDDVCLLAPDTVNNRLGVSHFDAFDLGGPVGLTWTNPRHAPVERVVVVRREDRFPEAWDDGVIVYDESDIEIGATVERVDPNGSGGKAYYAIYATDGADWSDFTIEGINADAVSTAGTPGGEFLTELGGEVAAAAQGCGCAGSPAPAGGVGVLLLAGLVIPRRRAAGGRR